MTWGGKTSDHCATRSSFRLVGDGGQRSSWVRGCAVGGAWGWGGLVIHAEFLLDVNDWSLSWAEAGVTEIVGEICHGTHYFPTEQSMIENRKSNKFILLYLKLVNWTGESRESNCSRNLFCRNFSWNPATAFLAESDPNNLARKIA